MVDPKSVCLFIPGNLKKFKLNLFERIGQHIKSLGGHVIRNGDIAALEALPNEIVPIVGCMPEITSLIQKWKAMGRKRIQWDRGYCRRVFATWLPRGESGGYYRWHCDAFQLRKIGDFPDDRWRALKIETRPWAKGGRHIVIAAPTPTYERFHGIETWTDTTIRYLAKHSDRQIVIRHKDSSRPLQADLDGAHCLVSNGSMAGVEAAILGCPVFENPESAAALVGQTDLSKIEAPVYPDRQPWLNSLAYSQFSEAELCDGTLWKLLS